jgi:hypothetical protein
MDSDKLLPQQGRAGLKQMAEALSAAHIRYALIGGIAVSFRSQPRYTKDLDFLLEIPQIKLPALLAELQTRGFTFDTAKTIQEWTQHHLAVLEYHGVRIDWLKPVIPLYSHVIDKSQVESWMDASLPIASVESLILTKLIGFRSQDQVDIENLLAANPGKIDIGYIRSEWAGIAQPDDSRMKRFEELAAKFYRPGGSSNAN